MKKVLLPILLIASFAISSIAQLTKEEEKEWAKKIKSLTPESYKQLIEEKDALFNEVNTLKSQNSDLQTKLSEKDNEIAAVNKQLQEATAAKQQEPSATPTETTTHETTHQQHSTTNAKGVIYKVQIGVFKNKDLSKYFENNPNFSGETDEDGSKKYTLGSFTSYWEAENFKKYLREMGVKDAWVVAYKNGKRVEIKDALEGTL
jgi:hypothetical protein